MIISTYHRILFLDLRPWILEKEPQLKFKLLLAELEPELYQFQPAYEVETDRPRSARLSYFRNQIEYTAVRYYNNFCSALKATNNENEKTYLIRLHLKMIASIMTDLRATVDRISPTKETLKVLEMLKHQLVRLYLEVTEMMEEDKPDEVLTMFSSPKYL